MSVRCIRRPSKSSWKLFTSVLRPSSPRKIASCSMYGDKNVFDFKKLERIPIRPIDFLSASSSKVLVSIPFLFGFIPFSFTDLSFDASHLPLGRLMPIVCVLSSLLTLPSHSYNVSYISELCQIDVWLSASSNILRVVPFKTGTKILYAFYWSQNPCDIFKQLESQCSNLWRLMFWN